MAYTTQHDRFSKPHDLCLMIKPGISVNNVLRAVSSVFKGERYELLSRHISPSPVLPTTHLYGCKHKFNEQWLKKYPSWCTVQPVVAYLVLPMPCFVQNRFIVARVSWLTFHCPTGYKKNDVLPNIAKNNSLTHGMQM